MGHIELNDSVSRRRIRVMELNDVIRIDVSEDQPYLVVPEDTVIKRHPSRESSDSEGRRM